MAASLTSHPEFWGLVITKAMILTLGGLLTGLSYAAFNRTGNRAYRVAAAGFALIVLGSLVEAGYETGIRRSVELSGRELLALHTVEGLLVAIGLAALFLSVRRF